MIDKGTLIVTGAAGFIGSHLCRALLDRGHSVVGIDNFDPFYPRPLKEANIADLNRARFELVEADVCDQAAMIQVCERHRPQGVFHIAALAGVRPSILDPVRYARTNVDGLLSVLEAARGVGCDRFVFASSSSVYGDSATVPFSEDDPVAEPISPYAATKRAGELLCHTYSKLFGLSIAVLRFFTVYGPGQRPDLAIGKFMRAIASGDEVEMFGDGTTSRDYTFIDDIIRGVLAASEKIGQEPQGFYRIYNLGGSKPIVLTEMIELIGQVVGERPRIRRLPMQPGDVRCTYADLRRSSSELGFAPLTEFPRGLERQWEWLRASLQEA